VSDERSLINVVALGAWNGSMRLSLALSLTHTLSLAESGCGHINTLQAPSATTLLHTLYVHSLHYLTFLETSFLERIDA